MLNNDKISARQVFVVFVMSTFSPATRLLPSLCANYGGVAGWLGPAAAGAALAALMAAMASMFKGSAAPRDLSDAFEAAFGRLGRRAALSVYLLWTLLLYFIYIRYYAERLMGTTFPNVDIRFFLIPMLVLVFIAARGKIEAFARFAEVTILIFTAVFAVLFICFIPSIKPSNLLPVTPYDAPRVAASSLPAIHVWGFFTLFFFLGEHISNRHEIGKYIKKSVIYLVAIATATLVSIIGSLNYKTVTRMPTPFFSATKLIQVVRSFDRMEAILLSLWVVSDFVTILAFAFIAMNIAKKLFGTPDTRPFASPTVLLGYVGGIAVASNGLELESFSANPAVIAVNISLCTLFPLAVCLIVKLKTKKKSVVSR
ncbi:MAG: spore germination protein [Oscillospiraceae bacterium]|jgi:spore germination protein KB|nr:spore germination protein [Oscillospiraceae bacterium]